MDPINPHRRVWFGLLLLAMAIAPASAPAQEAVPDPIALYQNVLSTVRAAEAFSVHVEKQFDVLMLDGAKVEYSGALDLIVKQAGALHLDYGDDTSAKEVWYDGQTLTIIDHLSNIYAELPAEGSVRSVIADINARYGLELPLAALINLAPEDFQDAVQSTTYLGLHDAASEPCHHVLYRGANVDLQVWVTTGDEPLLRKMVVTFWQIEGAPQQSLLFSDWDLNPRTNRKQFVSNIPEGAIRTEFLPVEEAAL